MLVHTQLLTVLSIDVENLFWKTNKPLSDPLSISLHIHNYPLDYTHSGGRVLLYRCGQETRVVPRILQMRNHWYKSSKESMRLKEAGVSEEVINSAVASFILEVIARHGVPAPRLCNKDPLALKSMDYLKVLFPNAKYIFMVRDGRATVHSIISRRVSHWCFRSIPPQAPWRNL